MNDEILTRLAATRVRLAPSPIHGVGVFAVREIAKGEDPFAPGGVVEKYSPDQPRDEQGQWTSGGGNAGGSAPSTGVPFSASAFHGSSSATLHEASSTPDARQFDNATSQFGAFVTLSGHEAGRYAGKAGTVYRATVSLANPYVMPWGEFAYFQDTAHGPRDADGFRGKALPPSAWAARGEALKGEASALRQELERKGHDGIVVTARGGRPEEIVSFRAISVAKRAPLLVLTDAQVAALPAPVRTMVAELGARDEVVKYSPDQPRDDQGQWTDGGGQSSGLIPEGERTTAVRDLPAVREEVARLTGRFGISEGRVDIPEAGRAFEAGGLQWDEAAHVDLKTNRITLRPAFFEHEDASTRDGMFAHEVMHTRFNAVLTAYRGEYRDADRETEATQNAAREAGRPDYHTAGPMNAAGYLRAVDGAVPESVRARYPTLAALEPHLGADRYEAMQQDDGFTAYSRAWWKSWNGGTRMSQGIMTPVHETLAEVARVWSGGVGERAPSKVYVDLYNAVNAEATRLGVQGTLPHARFVKRDETPVLMFVDAQFNPVTPERAAMVKVVDGERHVWAYRAVQVANGAAGASPVASQSAQAGPGRDFWGGVTISLRRWLGVAPVAKYSPEQPREPAGSSEGGRFALSGVGFVDAFGKDRPFDRDEVGDHQAYAEAEGFAGPDNVGSALKAGWVRYSVDSGNGSMFVHFAHDNVTGRRNAITHIRENAIGRVTVDTENRRGEIQTSRVFEDGAAAIRTLRADLVAKRDPVWHLPASGLLDLPTSAYLNASSRPNLATDDGGVTFHTLRPVEPGEELTLDYPLAKYDPDQVVQTFAKRDVVPIAKTDAAKGAMVAVRLPPDAARELVLPGGEAPERLHLTVLFLGEAASIPEATLAALREGLIEALARVPPFAVRVSGYGRFAAVEKRDDVVREAIQKTCAITGWKPSDMVLVMSETVAKATGEDVVWLSVDAPELEGLREAVVTCARAAGIDYPQEHGFTPHISLGISRDEAQIQEWLRILAEREHEGW